MPSSWFRRQVNVSLHLKGYGSSAVAPFVVKVHLFLQREACSFVVKVLYKMMKLSLSPALWPDS